MANIQSESVHFLKRFKGLVFTFLSSLIILSVIFILPLIARENISIIVFIVFSYLLSGTMGVIFKQDKFSSSYPLIFVLILLIGINLIRTFLKTEISLLYLDSLKYPLVFFFNLLFICYLAFFVGFFTPAGLSSLRKLLKIYLRRFIALLCDFFLLGFISFILSFFLSDLISPFAVPAIVFLFCFLYFTLSFLWKNQTLGMALMKIKVEGIEESKITPNQAIIRTLLFPYSILLMSFVFSFLSRTELMLHDIASKTFLKLDHDN